MKQVILISFLALTFAACETETYIDFQVENRSSEEILVEGRDRIHSKDISHSISPGTTKVVLSWSKRGKETDLFEPEGMFGDDLLITNAQGDTLQRNYKDLSNWSTDVEEERAVASHEYTLVVRDDDFE